MTLEEMAAELRRNGWRVQEPLTQKNCAHWRALGSVSMNSDGSGAGSRFCPDCGLREEYKYPPRKTEQTFSLWSFGRN